MHQPFAERRLEDLNTLELLDSLPEKKYDNITSLAALICDTPISLVSLVSDKRQFFKSNHGLDINETPIEQSFCAHAINDPLQFFIVEDAREDYRFSDNPLVTGNPKIVFYTGIPLVSNEGNALGTLCVIDTKPRKLEPKQLKTLKLLADQVLQFFENRKDRFLLKKMTESFTIKSKHFDNIIDATHLGTWEWNLNDGKVSINERYAEILGYSIDELDSLNIDQFEKLLYQDDIKIVNEQVAAYLEKKTDFYEVDLRFLHKKGHIVWIHSRGQVIRWSSNGKPLLMAGINVDITEIRNTETQFKTITNNIPGVVFRYKLYPDGSDELLLVSEGAVDIWGFSAEEVMKNSQLIWGNTENEDIEVLVQSIQKSAQELSFWEQEWRHHNADGTIRWFKGVGNPIRAEDGSTIWDSIVLDITIEKENELEVERSESRFKGLVQNGSDLITIMDYDGNIKYISPSSAKILAINPTELIAKNNFDIIHPNDKKAFIKSLLKLKTKKQLTPKPYRIKHGNGSWCWLETVLTDLMNDSAIVGIVANSRDITARILVEKKLKKSKAYYKGLSESQTNYVIRTDINLNYTYVNKIFIDEFGWLYPDGKILGNNYFSSILDYHHQRTKETVEKCIAEPEKVFKIEINKPSSDGKTFTTLWDFVCLKDTYGKPSEIQCVGQDISDRIKSEKALKKSELSYSNLFHLSPQPKYIYEIATLKFLDVNKAAIERYGYSYQEFLNMTLREIRPESEFLKLDESLKLSAQKGGPKFFGEHVHKMKNGEEIIVDLRAHGISHKGKKAKVVLATDVTERYNYIKAIEAQNEKLKQIAWTHSHEVRAPLTNIMGLIEVLNCVTLSAAEKEEFTKYLMTSANELDSVVKNIVKTTEQVLIKK
tara:strand:+ start:4057 stop:6699 length:2643 start_codon:yes stop_codon:yes gene_type:complete